MNDLKQKFKKLILISGDILLLYLSLFITLKLRFGAEYTPAIWSRHFYPFSTVYLFWILIFYINNFYSISYSRNIYKFCASAIKSFVFIGIFSIIFFYTIYSTTGLTPKTNLALNILIFAILFLSWRIFFSYFAKTKTLSTNILILADNNDEEVREIIKEISQNPQLGYNTVPYSEDNTKNVAEFIAKNNIKLVITSEKIKNNPDLLHKLYELLSLKIKFENLPNFYEQIFEKIPFSVIDKIWFLENIKSSDRPFYDLFKRSADIALSVAGLIISLPFYPFIIAAIKLDNKGPAFIIQDRVGQNNKIIKNIKFRSMLVNDRGKWPEENDKRITKIGKILRKTRIDELPQLINVIKGDISLVGPRPDIIDLYKKLEVEIPYYNVRNLVKPGLSGWAQIHQEVPPHSIEATKQRLAYDFYYIKNKSLVIDILIALKTIKTIISQTGK